jgi:hypothetical protein
MYRCAHTDFNMIGSRSRGSDEDQPSMVYGYVNGKRTECMSESEFRSRFQCSERVPNPPAITSPYTFKANTSVSSTKNYAGSNFSGADLFNMDFQFANCRNSNFSGADMRSARLTGADCHGANFEGALVKNANLRNADISEANLRNAYFVSCDLRGVKGLTIDGVRLAATVCNCKLDPELAKQINMYCPFKYRDISHNWGLSEDDKNVRVRRVSK